MTVTAGVQPCPLMNAQLSICAEALGRNKAGLFVSGLSDVRVELYKRPNPQGADVLVEAKLTGAGGAVVFDAQVQRAEMDLYSVTADASTLRRPHVLSTDTTQEPKPLTAAALKLKVTPNPKIYNVTFYLVPLKAVPAALDFAAVPLGTATPALDVVIENPGIHPLTVKSIQLTGPGAAAFAVAPARVNAALEPGRSVRLQVTAKPQGQHAQPRCDLEVTTAERAVLRVPLAASSYSVKAAPLQPFKPGSLDAKLLYTIDDPKGVVTGAKVEILDARDAMAVIHTIANAPHAPGRNHCLWRGEVTLRTNHATGLIEAGRSPYLGKITIAQGGAVATHTALFSVTAADVGDLLISLQRTDGAALAGRASFRVVCGAPAYDQTLPTVAAAAGGEELLIRGLAPGNYQVSLQNPAAVRNAENQSGLSPAQSGVAAVQVSAGERVTSLFELSDYTRVQFVALYATPTGTTVQGPPINIGGPPTWVITYRGEADDRYDMLARCEILKKAMSDAEANHGHIPVAANTLKVFMAPEFYFRGIGGGYPFELVAEILPFLSEEASKPKYQDWLFVCGTAIGFFRHHDPLNPGQPVQHQLAVTRFVPGFAGAAGLNGAPPIPARLPRVHVQEDPALRDPVSGRTTSATAGICKNIVANQGPPGQWQLRHNADTPILQAVRISDTEYALDLPANTVVALGPVVLLEPVGTEILNVALVQRGGPGRGPNRELLVYKEAISGIDFHGSGILPDYGGLGDFGSTMEKHRANVHGQADVLLLPTMGSTHYMLSSAPNPSAPGGTSEQNRSGLGGGSIFTMAGVNFGMEVCLDHLYARLSKYAAANTTPGDPVPQVLLIPSWGMDIPMGPSYASAAGALFNVDGRNHIACLPDAGTLTHLRCPDVPHPNPVAGFVATCPVAHYTCTRPHKHFQVAGGACARCGVAVAAAFTCSAHFSFGNPTCNLCGAALVAAHEFCSHHNAWYALNAHAPCGNGGVITLGYYCNANHYASTNPCACRSATVPAINMHFCDKHNQTGYAAVNCPACAQMMVADPVPRQLKTVRAAANILSTVPVNNPGAPHVLNQVMPGGRRDETVTTVVTTRVTLSNVLVSETSTVTPAGLAPMEIPATAPTNVDNAPPSGGGTRCKREWVTGTVTLSSELVTTQQVAGLDTITTEVTTTKLTGTVTADQANLFAAQSQLRIFSPIALPPAEVR